jgi:hypothetical protein
MIQLNLLPDVKKEYLRAQSFRAKTISLSILATIVAVGATAVLASYVYGGQLLIGNLQKDDIKAKTKELQSKKDIEKYLTIQNQLASIDGLHDSKTISSRLLEVLPRLNPLPPNNVKFANVKLSTLDSTIGFQGGTKDFSALTTFRDTLTNAKINFVDGEQSVSEPLFKTVTIVQSGYSKSESVDMSVGFTISAEYNPNLLSGKIKNFSITVPNIETTQSVVASPGLFEPNAGALNGQQ